MAQEESPGEKSEEPSSKREEDFRNEGQIARSPEVSSLIVLGSAAVAMIFFGAQLGRQIAEGTAGVFQFQAGNVLSNFSLWMSAFAAPVMKTMGSILGVIFLVSLVAGLSETGIVFSTKSLAPKIDSLNPLEGLKRMMQMKTAVQFVKNLAKIGAIGWIAYSVIRDRIREIMLSSTLPLLSQIHWMLGLIATIAIKIGVFLLILAVVDYVYQWRSLRKKMMMSRHDLKEEAKENQVSDQVRGKVRQLQKERSKRTIQKEVPTADVIITNPTHFAVALRYKRSLDRAPRVVAKGMDQIALYIRKVAAEHNVVIYEYPELARGLYKQVKVGRTIPGDLYESVARVLAYVYQLHHRSEIARQQAFPKGRMS